MGHSGRVLFEEVLRDILREVVREEFAPIVERLNRIEAQGAQTPPAAEEYITAAEAAKVASVRADTVREWVRRGDLPAHRAGRLLRVRRDELEAYLARQSNGASVSREAAARVKELLRDACEPEEGRGVQRDRRRRK